MATTTAEAIRDRIITVIEALVPTTNTKDRFKRYTFDAGIDDFRKWATGNPQGSLRRFFVRTLGTDEIAEVSNGDVEAHYVDFLVLVAYPQTNHIGLTALDRDDAQDQDRHAIEGAIGLRGAANFAGAFPDACYRGPVPSMKPVDRELGAGVDFLVITQRMSFYRAFP